MKLRGVGVLVAAIFLLAACQTVSNSTKISPESHSERLVRLFVEYCLDYSGRAELRLETVQELSEHSNNVSDVSHYIQSQTFMGFPFYYYLLEGSEFLMLRGPDAQVCNVSSNSEQDVTVESAIAAFQAVVSSEFYRTERSGTIVYKVLDYTTTVDGREVSVQPYVEFLILRGGYVVISMDPTTERH